VLALGPLGRDAPDHVLALGPLGRDAPDHARAPLAATCFPKAQRARLVAATLADAAPLAKGATPELIELELGSYAGLDQHLGAGDVLFHKRLLRCYAQTSAEMDRLLAMRGRFEVVVYLTRDTAAAVRALGEPPARLALVQPNYDRVSAAHERDVDLPAFFASYTYPVPVENVPSCLLGRSPRPHPPTLDVAMLGPDARVDMAAYARRYVADAYYTKAVRCAECSENASCRGVHVNWVRAHGFAPLSPLGGVARETERGKGGSAHG
jgi:hypothetical protein